MNTGVKWKPFRASLSRKKERIFVFAVLAKLHPTVLEVPPRSYRG